MVQLRSLCIALTFCVLHVTHPPLNLCTLTGQPLEPWCHELLSWASMRGQLLQRTVHGMM